MSCGPPRLSRTTSTLIAWRDVAPAGSRDAAPILGHSKLSYCPPLSSCWCSAAPACITFTLRCPNVVKTGKSEIVVFCCAYIRSLFVCLHFIHSKVPGRRGVRRTMLTLQSSAAPTSGLICSPAYKFRRVQTSVLTVCSAWCVAQ